MGKSSPRLPPTPDPNELINAQADANRITQYTPRGNLRFGYVGDQGQFVEAHRYLLTILILAIRFRLRQHWLG